jgi:hypothetical protein
MKKKRKKTTLLQHFADVATGISKVQSEKKKKINKINKAGQHY